MPRTDRNAQVQSFPFYKTKTPYPSLSFRNIPSLSLCPPCGPLDQMILNPLCERSSSPQSSLQRKCGWRRAFLAVISSNTSLATTATYRAAGRLLKSCAASFLTNELSSLE